MIQLGEVDKILYEIQRQGLISFYMTNYGEEAYVTTPSSSDLLAKNQKFDFKLFCPSSLSHILIFLEPTLDQLQLLILMILFLVNIVKQESSCTEDLPLNKWSINVIQQRKI